MREEAVFKQVCPCRNLLELCDEMIRSGPGPFRGRSIQLPGLGGGGGGGGVSVSMRLLMIL